MYSGMGHIQLVAGTGWLFASPRLELAFDHLFVDEAGQVSLANLVALSTCSKKLVLLGDQMQLAQPTQGVHPEGWVYQLWRTCCKARLPLHQRPVFFKRHLARAPRCVPIHIRCGLRRSPSSPDQKRQPALAAVGQGC